MPASSRRSLLLGAGGLSLARPALAQAFPARPIRIIVPATPGGQSDIGARALAELLREETGQPVVVENRTGAGGQVGLETTLRAPKDGYTLGMFGDSAVLINPLLQRHLAYSPGDMLLLTPLYTGTFVVAVNNSFPARNMADFSAEVRRRGGLSYGAFGVTSAPRILAEMICMATGLSLEPVPYRGETEAVTDLIAGSVPAFVGTTVAVREQHRAGALRVLGVSQADRVAALGDVPTFAEQGLPSVQYRWFHGLTLQSGVPTPIVEFYAGILPKLIRSERFRIMIGPDVTPAPMTPDDFAGFVQQGRDRVAAIIRERGIPIN
ncbi:Bug family tripartite tricarboxylate transporter substrate binding protein [Belnapia moabensis]|uniref:Bug family tripartite tricarboxylate transporter substrate binding protein n=1 Tax=Belnapia moabensis TaxID=365533 RepID=UPI0006936982|nr:tripartite tricarboxylate transporter substrate binding protein [Belnapia moabensis]